MPLFENVSYYISESILEETRTEIKRILDFNGAISTSLKDATHIISNTIEFEGRNTLVKNAVCVTPYWVERSMELGILQDVLYFSADKALFFSGVVATCADLPEGDREVIMSGIQERGGSWREGLTRDVTHLIVTNLNSEKYKVAMRFRETAHIIVVLPQWFDQCWAMQMLIPTTLFQFPDPPFLKHAHDPSWYKAQLSDKEKADYLADGFDKKAMFHVLAREPSFRQRSPRDIWQGKKILLSASLELNDTRKKALEERIRLAGGLVLSGEVHDEERIVDSADVFITRYRSGAAYARALGKGKTIGTLAWFLYVDKTGIISRPPDQLLHYPVHPDPIPGFEHHEITVTNYQGDAREYLKKLIQLMGARFTPTMSGKNTVVIAAYKGGTKTSKAEEWSVPVVHHKWLEDCFVQWRNLTPAVKKYVDFASGFNYGTLLGHRGVGNVGLTEIDKDKDQAPEIVAKTSSTPLSPSKSPKKPQSAPRLAEATNSFRDALEVKEVEEVLNITGPLPDTPIRLGPSRSAQSPMKKQASNKPLSASITNPVPGPPTTISSGLKKKRPPVIDEHQQEEKEEDLKEKRNTVRDTKSSNSKLLSKPLTEPEEVDSDDSIREIPLPSNKIGLSTNAQGFSAENPRSGKLAKRVHKDKAKNSSDEKTDDELSEAHQLASPPKSKPKPKSPTKPTSIKRPLQSPSNHSSDSEIVEIKRPKVIKTYKSPTKAKSKVTHPVLSSSLSSDDAGKEKKATSGHKEIAQKAIHPSSSRTVCVELPDAMRPVLKKKLPIKPSTLSKDDPAQPIPVSDDTSAISNSLTSRRSAAAAATQKLRTQIMPDVIHFENERKKSAASTRRRKSSLGTALQNSGDGDDSEASVRVVKRARLSAATEESEDKPDRFVTHVKNYRKTAKEDESSKKVHGSSKPNGAVVKQSDGSSSMDSKKIRILTTKIDIPDDVEQVLIKLGAKFTTKPSECTHLVASGMARTEKFLCALPQAPYVLSKDWLAACAKEKKIVDEEPFNLQDPDVEHKHKFKLSEALQRARELKKKKVKLLQGHTFYITPNVKVDHDMLINILKANGADGKRATPNARNLADTKHAHVLSCLKDEHLWRSLSKSGIPIYSQELVLSAAFKQSIDWDSPEMKVQVEDS